MGQHFLYHRDLISATAVHHTVYANLTNDEKSDLVIVGPNWLRIYQIEPFQSSEASQESKLMYPTQNANVFHLIDSFPLAGIAESLAVLTFDPSLLTRLSTKDMRKRNRIQDLTNRQDNSIVSGKFCGRHVLLLSFAMYKWVMIGYDRSTRSIITLGLFTFEEDAVGLGATLSGEKNGREQMLGTSTRPTVRVDPQSRCGSMLIYSDQLVIVPFRSGKSSDSAYFSDDEEEETWKDKKSEQKSKDELKETSLSDSEVTDQEENEDEKNLKRILAQTREKCDLFKPMSKENDINKSEAQQNVSATLLDKSVKLGIKRKRSKSMSSARAKSADISALSTLASGVTTLAYDLTGKEFLLRLRELDIKGRIIDFCFLYGYLEPTIMILHEENERVASSGRFAAGYDTNCLTVLSITLNTRLHPAIWRVKNLPSDCFQIIPCKTPIGGAVILSANAILYFNQTRFYGMKLNIFAEKTVNQSLFPCKDAIFECQEPNLRGNVIAIKKRLDILLYECQYEYIGSFEILFALSDGSLYALKIFHGDTAQDMASGKFTLRQIQAIGSVASCLCVNEESRTLLIGSRSGDSILYEYSHVPIAGSKSLMGETDEMETPIESHQMQAHEKEAEKRLQQICPKISLYPADAEDSYLYGSTMQSVVQEESGNAQTSFQETSTGLEDAYLMLQALDSLPSIGQITCMDLGVQNHADIHEQHEELVIGGGSLRYGSISIIHNGLRPIVSTAAELSGCRAMWSVVGLCDEDSNSNLKRTHDSYLILSMAQRTMILHTGEEMEPLEDDSGFYTCGPTLCAGNMFHKRRIIQVFKQGVRVMKQSFMRVNKTQDPATRLICTQEIPLEGEIECGGMNIDTSTVGIVSVDMLDPFILILLTDGSVRLLMGDEDLELAVIDPEIAKISTQCISAACLFHDYVGMFSDERCEEQERDDAVVFSQAYCDATSSEEEMEEEDDEMTALYAIKDVKRTEQSRLNQTIHDRQTKKSANSVSIPLLLQNKAPILCGICYEDGSLHVFSLPDFTKRGIFSYMNFAPQWLVNSLSEEKNASSARRNATSLGFNAFQTQLNSNRIQKSHAVHSPVADITIHRIGPSEGEQNAQLLSCMVLLVFLASGDLLVYKAMPMDAQYGFVRVHGDLITRPYVASKTSKDSSLSGMENASSVQDTSAILAKLRANFRYPMLTRFYNVNHWSGVFFRGARPLWLLPIQGEPTLVPMNVAKNSASSKTVPALCFTAFHHWNCPNGFIYFHSSGSLRICELPSTKSCTILPASGGFVVHKLQFGTTIHHLLYLGSYGPGGVAEALQFPTFAIVMSRKMAISEIEALCKAENETELETEEMEAAELDAQANNVMAPTAEKFPDLAMDEMPYTEEDMYELRLVQANEDGEWAGQGVFRAYFERYEVILSVKVMYLFDVALAQKRTDNNYEDPRRRNEKTEPFVTEEEWNRRKRPYLVIGTGYVGLHGEDATGRGRLLLYEVDYAQYVDAQGSASAKLPKLRLIFIKEHHQGAITSVIQLGHYVLASVGSKLIVYEFKSDQLIGCAFYDAQIFITSLHVIRNEYVMYGDVYKSVSFLRWREKDRQLILLAKDYEPLAVTAAEFNVCENRLAIIAADVEENLHVLQYAPHDIESRGGQRLLRTSDFHIGMQISCIFRKAIYHKNVYLNILGSSEGSVSALIPVHERVFRRLYTLQSVMISTLAQNCALNPREFRNVKNNGRTRSGRMDAWCKQKYKKGFLDGQVLCRFLHLDIVAQKELAKCIGTTPQVIIHNLLELQCHSVAFL